MLVIGIPVGVHQYKFKVDDMWRLDDQNVFNVLKGDSKKSLSGRVGERYHRFSRGYGCRCFFRKRFQTTE